MMNLVRCPRCELNFMLKGEKICKVCQREIEGDRQEEDVELCSVCGQAPVMPGRDVCQDCAREMEDEEESRKETGADIEPETDENAEEETDDILEGDDAVTAELGELGNELSLEDVAEDEERDADDEEEGEEL